MKERIEVGDDIHLRLLAEADAGELHALIEANRAYLAPWLPWAARQTFEDTLSYIREGRSQASQDQAFQAALVVGAGIVGAIGYPEVDWANRSTRIGYWIEEAQQGRGIVTAAVSALLGHAFADLGLNRVAILAATGNRRSRAVPERLGFREEGTLRQLQLVDGRYLDCVSYSMLAADWGGEDASPILGLDHVQVAAPAGCESEGRRFYGELLGLVELEKPASLQRRGGVWFGCGAQQLHVGVVEDFSPARKAHPALRVGAAELGRIAERLTAAGGVVSWDDAIPGTRRFYSADPWGNRIELLAAVG